MWTYYSASEQANFLPTFPLLILKILPFHIIQSCIYLWVFCQYYLMNILFLWILTLILWQYCARCQAYKEERDKQAHSCGGGGEVPSWEWVGRGIKQKGKKKRKNSWTWTAVWWLRGAGLGEVEEGTGETDGGLTWGGERAALLWNCAPVACVLC